MKYFKIDIKRFYIEEDRIASGAQGKDIEDAEYYFWKMDKGENIENIPLLDCFYLESFDKREFWEWKVFDVHNFIGEGSQIPGWLISDKLKEVFNLFNIAKPHIYYTSKLLYKAEKLNYNIFQFSGKKFRIPLTNYINFSIQNEKELLEKQEKILEESGFDIINIPIKKLVLFEPLDFISMQNFLGDKLVSERLKKAIEENNITGFEFSELDYEVIVEITV